MKHVTEQEMLLFISGGIDSRLCKEHAAHIDACEQCRRRYIETLLPSTRTQENLSDHEKEELFESIMARHAAQMQPRARVIPWTGTIARHAVRYAVAAVVLIALLPAVFLYRAVHNRGIPAEAPQYLAEALQLASVSGGVSIDGVSHFRPMQLDTGYHRLVTSDTQMATITMGADVKLTFMENTSCSVNRKGANTVQLELIGELLGTLRPHCGKQVFVGVTGGTYHIVGTIFRIRSDSAGSTIKVEEGKVAFIPDCPGMPVDTIPSATTREFAVLFKHVNPTEPKVQPTVQHADTVDSSFLLIDTAGVPAVSRSTTAPPNKLLVARRMLMLRRPIENIIDTLNALYEGVLPDSALLFVAAAFEREGKFDNAYAWYCKVAMAQTGSDRFRGAALVAKGRIDFQAHHNLQDASNAYRTYLELYPSGIYKDKAYEGMYTCYFKNDDFRKQIQTLEQWIDESPSNDYPVYLLASTYREREQYRFAVRYYQTYRLKYPQGRWIEDAYLWEWKCYHHMGLTNEYAKAIQEYKRKFPNGKWIEEKGN
jgi:hypothetical protein